MPGILESIDTYSRIVIQSPQGNPYWQERQYCTDLYYFFKEELKPKKMTNLLDDCPFEFFDMDSQGRTVNKNITLFMELQGLSLDHPVRNLISGIHSWVVFNSPSFEFFRNCCTANLIVEIRINDKKTPYLCIVKDAFETIKIDIEYVDGKWQQIS